VNPQCRRCTFSVLPPLVLRYCRFLWPDLLAVKDALDAGTSAYRLARTVWHVGRRVIVRAAVLLTHMGWWVEALHREMRDGRPARALRSMVKRVACRLGRGELTDRWYRHRYPLRFC